MTGDAADKLRELAAAASVEVTPKDVPKLEELDDPLPAGTAIYITSLPGADPFDLVAAASAVRAHGLAPVPHLAARSIASVAQLDHLLGRLAGEGVDDVLVIAGGTKTPAGELASSLDVLRTGLLERHGMVRAGVAGHPEGSPDIPPHAVAAALLEKNAYAAASPIDFRLVTQFALDAAPYLRWEREIRDVGNRLPVHVGLPGVTSPPTLLKFAVACGVGPSIEVLRKRAGGLVRLATTRHWTPDELAAEVAAGAAAEPHGLIRGFHLFPFGGVGRTATWLARVRGAAAAHPAVT